MSLSLGLTRPIPSRPVGPAKSFRPLSRRVPSPALRRGSGGHVCRAAESEAESAQFEVQLIPSISEVSAAECAELDPAGGGTSPFVSHAFLNALEESGSVCRATGWLPQHLLLRERKDKRLVGAVPLYLKAHSYGEYVFDQSWASAAARNGIRYYPKLQSCVPFTPCTGPRLLLSPDAPPGAPRALARALRAAADEYNVSSLHVTFPTGAETDELTAAGFRRRVGVQYHWVNRGYASFDDFLMALQQKRRKSVRQERKKATEGLRVARPRGAEISAATWDAFYDFYVDTADRKWGQAYLTREFFHRLGAAMGDSVVLVVAAEETGGKPVGAALNLVGSNAIFGRNWGCSRYVPGLHFEVCYYQAIEEAIERGLSRVEAGAQGEHKIQRGYLPVATHSAHYVRDPRLAEAVGRFLVMEAEEMQDVITTLGEESPYKDSPGRVTVITAEPPPRKAQQQSAAAAGAGAGRAGGGEAAAGVGASTGAPAEATGAGAAAAAAAPAPGAAQQQQGASGPGGGGRWPGVRIWSERR